MKGRKNAVIYLRKAVKNQEGDSTLRPKEEWIKEQALRRGYTVVAAFSDEGISGRSEQRPGLTQALNFLSHRTDQGPITLLTSDINDLARDIPLFERLKRKIAGTGATLAVLPATAMRAQEAP